MIVIREMPFGQIQLKNMLALSDAGGIVSCASPGFYHRPQSYSIKSICRRARARSVRLRQQFIQTLEARVEATSHPGSSHRSLALKRRTQLIAYLFSI